LNSVAETIHGSVFRAAAAHPERTALMYRSGGRYLSVSYTDLTGAVELAAGRIAAFGIRKGDAVGIFSPNRPQWIVADLAALALGAIVVPVYDTLPPDRIKYIANDSGMRMLFVGDPDLFGKVGSIRSETPGLEEVIFLDDWGIRFGASGARSVGDAASPTRGGAADDVVASDVATIVYIERQRDHRQGTDHLRRLDRLVPPARALVRADVRPLRLPLRRGHGRLR